MKDDPTAQSTCDVIAEWPDGHTHTVAGLSYGRLRELLQSRQKPSKFKNHVHTARNGNGDKIYATKYSRGGGTKWYGAIWEEDSGLSRDRMVLSLSITDSMDTDVVVAWLTDMCTSYASGKITKERMEVNKKAFIETHGGASKQNHPKQGAAPRSIPKRRPASAAATRGAPKKRPSKAANDDDDDDDDDSTDDERLRDEVECAEDDDEEEDDEEDDDDGDATETAGGGADSAAAKKRPAAANNAGHGAPAMKGKKPRTDKDARASGGGGTPSGVTQEKGKGRANGTGRGRGRGRGTGKPKEIGADGGACGAHGAGDTAHIEHQGAADAALDASRELDTDEASLELDTVHDAPPPPRVQDDATCAASVPVSAIPIGPPSRVHGGASCTATVPVAAAPSWSHDELGSAEIPGGLSEAMGD